MVELSSLDVRLLALELRTLEDAYIDKVYQTGPQDFVLKLRHPSAGLTHLLVRSGQYVARQDASPTTPESPGTVAMSLRKHLSGARIRRIDQHEFDRVLHFSLERGGMPLEVVVELFGKGNLIVADEGKHILFALREETFAHRTIKRGERLVFPPARANPATMPRSEFEQRLAATDKDAVRFLALDVALGGDLAEELLHRAGIQKGGPARDLPPGEVDRLWDAFRALLSHPSQPAVTTTAKGIEIQSIPFESPLFREADREPQPTLSAAILRAADLESERDPKAVDEEAARLERQIAHQERGVVELVKEADRWERRGHLLFAHYATAAEVLQKAKATIEASDWATMKKRREEPPETSPWLASVVAVDPKKARIVVRLEDDEVPLDPFESLEANATQLYDEAKHLRAKSENARVALAEARVRLTRRKAAPTKAAAAASNRATGRRFWFEDHRWFFTTEGFLVVGGRDAGSNEKLVKRQLKPGDRYIHADFHGAPSCVLKCEGRTPGPESLRQACQFGATYSKAFNQFATADAYWVHPEQVSKSAESGEYVPRGAFVIRGTRNYEPKLPLEFAVGLVGLDRNGKPTEGESAGVRLMGGPPEAVLKRTPRVARILRGDQKPTDVAKRLAPLFGVSLDEVVKVLPAANLRVVSVPEAHR